MIKHRKFLLKVAAFTVSILILTTFVNRVLITKNYYDNTWPATSTFIDFYKLEKNTADVLFFGSSHGVSSFSPQKLYDDSIRSYNLSSQQQSLVVSYYWLKEALKYQTPEVIILETYLLYPYNSEEVLNSSEPSTRFAIDAMHWSKNKIDAVNDIAALDQKQSKESYYLPNIRFHERWKSLEENDLTFWEMDAHSGLKGFSALSKYCGLESYSPFQKGESEERREMVPLMREYLDRIVALCEEQGIELILVKTPSASQKISKYNTLMDYSAEKGVAFIDFNEEETYQKCDFDFPKNAVDRGHLNIWGAEKVTDYLGQYLEENCQIQKTADDQWESSSAYYDGIKKNCNLTKTSDINEYLQMIKDDRYTIFMCIKDDGAKALNDTIKENMRELGITSDFDKENAYRKSFYAVIENGNIVEKMADEEIGTSGTLRKGRVWYKISSAGGKVGDRCSINIGGEEYAKNKRGLNIVVYDNDLKQVVDAVAFDTYDSELTAVR